jgi:hypothetical protein
VNLENYKGWTPLINACYWGKREIVKRVMTDLRVNLNFKTTKVFIGIGAGFTALDVARHRGKLDIVKLIEDEIKRRKTGLKFYLIN